MEEGDLRVGVFVSHFCVTLDNSLLLFLGLR